MVSYNKARVISAEELKEMLDESSASQEQNEVPKERQNPSLERLLFIEAKNAKGTKSIYPCFVAGYTYDREPKIPEAAEPMLIFDVYIVQCMTGKFGLLEVAIRQSELTDSKRFWDLPPSKDIREITPWAVLEAGVQ